MCTEVLIDGKLISTLGEMREALGREPVYVNEADWYGPQTDGKFCLCGIKKGETAALLGRVAVQDGMDVVFERVEAAP